MAIGMLPLVAVEPVAAADRRAAGRAVVEAEAAVALRVTLANGIEP